MTHQIESSTIEEQVLKADQYERSDEREAYRNGYKNKTGLDILVSLMQVMFTRFYRQMHAKNFFLRCILWYRC